MLGEHKEAEADRIHQLKELEREVEQLRALNGTQAEELLEAQGQLAAVKCDAASLAEELSTAQAAKLKVAEESSVPPVSSMGSSKDLEEMKSMVEELEGHASEARDRAEVMRAERDRALQEAEAAREALAAASASPAGEDSSEELPRLRQNTAELTRELSSAKEALNEASEASSRATVAAASEVQLLRHELNAVTWQLEESRAECKELAEEVCGHLANVYFIK